MKRCEEQVISTACRIRKFDKKIRNYCLKGTLFYAKNESDLCIGSELESGSSVCKQLICPYFSRISLSSIYKFGRTGIGQKSVWKVLHCRLTLCSQWVNISTSTINAMVRMCASSGLVKCSAGKSHMVCCKWSAGKEGMGRDLKANSTQVLA